MGEGRRKSREFTLGVYLYEGAGIAPCSMEGHGNRSVDHLLRAVPLLTQSKKGGHGGKTGTARTIGNLQIRGMARTRIKFQTA